MSHTHQYEQLQTLRLLLHSITQRELASESTLAKKKCGLDLPSASAINTFQKVRHHLGKGMNGRWLGAMPVDAFLDKFVPAARRIYPLCLRIHSRKCPISPS